MILTGEPNSPSHVIHITRWFTGAISSLLNTNDNYYLFKHNSVWYTTKGGISMQTVDMYRRLSC